MDTYEPASAALCDVESTLDAIDRLTWDDSHRHDLIGLEIEAFPVRDGDGSGSRLPLHGPGGVVDIVGSGLGVSSLSAPRQPPVFATAEGGRIGFEPGGQVELSSATYSDASTLMENVGRTWNAVESVFRERDAGLVCLGLDPWNDVGLIPQQLDSGRYIAMDRYFSGTWPAGAVMMRNTCSLQVSVESGRGGVREERWLAANLISPLLAAIFSTGPGSRGNAETRTGVWQSIDPTRTGLPTWTTLNRPDPLDDVHRRTLAANVMYVEREGLTRPLEPGLSFGRWLRFGHEDLGRPTVQDLKTHLSTIFTEVRPRSGTLEMRAVDSLPQPWWIVPVVVIAGVLYDDTARSDAIELMAPFASRLDDIWRRSAREGLKSPELGGAASTLAEISMEGAARSAMFGAMAVAAAAEFFDRFTLRGRSPGEEPRLELVRVADENRRVASAERSGR